jgi:hypothetical protein
MELNLFNQILQFPNEINAIAACFEKINQVLSERNQVLSHLEIDDVPVYGDYHDYFIEHLSSIQIVVVKASTFKQMMDDNLLELQSYLIRAIPDTRTLADEFYKGPVKESWSKLSQLLEGLQWVTQSILPMHSIRENGMPYLNSLVLSGISTELQEKFQELETALNHSDLVLVGDLIKFEIVELLLKLNIVVDSTIDNEVVRHDLN